MISNDVQFDKQLMSNSLTPNHYEVLNSTTCRLLWITQNPLKIAVLIVSLLTKVKSRFAVLEAECDAVSRMYVQLVLAVIDSTADYEVVKTLLYER